MFKPTFNIVNVLLLFLTNLFVLSNSVKINTPQGVINGLTKSSSSGREFQAFLGIPYAKPPINNLRFQDPLAFGSWEGVYDGTKEGPACLQKHIYDNKLKFYVIGEEDCLHINVYTPNTNKLKKFAVMVFIHGGGFTCGSSSSAVYGPEFLVEKDVVLVTFNYRLGPLGFASTEDVELPGNYGLKDQVLALKWIQENIAAYGGDPDSVTIFGQSAGGASVHYHMMSPLSKGLFHRGIPMSGSAHCPWALGSPGMTRRRTIKIATALGCPSNSSKEIVDCLRSVSAHKLTDSLSELTQWGSSPVVPLPPVIEPKEVKNAFITFDPYNEKPTTPMMLGLTSEEGAFVVALFKSTPEGVDETLRELNEDFNRISKISVFMYQDEKINNYDELSENLRKFYFGEKTINRKTLTNVTNLYTDACLTQCTVSTAKHHKGSVYFYYFAQKGPHSVTHLMSNSTEYFGVSHSDDLMYLFPLTLMVPARKTLTEQEEKMKNEMVTLWTNFAKYGNPTPDKKWKEMSSEDINYLNIEDGKFEMRENLLTERVKFWENLVWRTNRAGTSEKDEL